MAEFFKSFEQFVLTGELPTAEKMRQEIEEYEERKKK